MKNRQLNRLMLSGLLFVLIPATACLAGDSVASSAIGAIRRDGVGIGIRFAAEGALLALAYVIFKRGRGILGRAFIAQWAMIFIASLLVMFFFLTAEDTALMSGKRTMKLMFLGFLLLSATGYVIFRLRDRFTGGQAAAIGIVIGILTNPAVFEYLHIGATITVGKDAPTIAAAMKMARPNNTVYVPKGLYKETDIGLKNGVRLRGDGIGKTIIRGRPSTNNWIIHASNVTGRIEHLTVEQTGVTEPLKFMGGIFVSEGHVPVVSCEARNTAGHGIVMGDAGNIVVENCIATGNLGVGIRVKSEGPGTKIVGCTAGGNKESGIDVTANHPVLIEHNAVEKNSVGIFVAGKKGRFTIKGNTARHNTDTGIAACKTEEVIVRDNLCENNTKHGIAVWDGVDKATVASNQCQGNQKCAIQVEDAEAVITGNICNNNASGIFVVNSPQAIIEKNSVKGSYEGSGIDCSRTAEALVKDNECTDCAFGGIDVENKENGGTGRKRTGAAQRVPAPTTGNGLASNARDKNGIRRTTPGTVTVTGNRCIGNSISGIYACGGGTIIVSDNIMSQTEGNGFLVQHGSDVRAEGNTCQQNRHSGICATDLGTVVTLASNKCIGNNHGGIWLEKGAQGEVSGNECLENGWCGIGIRDAGTSAALKANSCNDNGAWGIITWGGARLGGLPGDNKAERNYQGSLMERE